MFLKELIFIKRVSITQIKRATILLPIFSVLLTGE